MCYFLLKPCPENTAPGPATILATHTPFCLGYLAYKGQRQEGQPGEGRMRFAFLALDPEQVLPG